MSRPVATASRVPSGLKASAVATLAIGSGVDRDPRTFQSRGGPLSRAIASSRPRGSKASAAADCTGNFVSERVRTFQRVTAAGLATASVLPSGLKARPVAASPVLRGRPS